MLSALKREHGTAVVEFALVAPVLFLIVFGIIDFSRALNYYNNLTQLAGQGARAAARNQNPDGTSVSGTSIQQQLATTFATSGEMQGKVHTCIPTLPGAVGQPVTVKTKFTTQFFFGLTDLTLSAASTQRSEAIATYTAGGYPDGAAC